MGVPPRILQDSPRLSEELQVAQNPVTERVVVAEAFPEGRLERNGDPGSKFRVGGKIAEPEPRQPDAGSSMTPRSGARGHMTFAHATRVLAQSRPVSGLLEEETPLVSPGSRGRCMKAIQAGPGVKLREGPADTGRSVSEPRRRRHRLAVGEQMVATLDCDRGDPIGMGVAMQAAQGPDAPRRAAGHVEDVVLLYENGKIKG